MTEFQMYLTFGVFAGVILAIAFNVIDMTLATLLGVSTLIVAGVFTQDDMLRTQQMAGGAIALLFGGMVVARILATTGIFERVGRLFLRATKGSGKRFLLGLLVLVVPLCAVLPNATVVILLAPIVIQVAQALKVDFVGPLVLTAIISNSAGLLTLVGDPATFLVGSSIGMTFTQYLQRVSAGGLLSVLVLIPLIPRVMGEVWRVQRDVPATLQPEPLKRPVFAVMSLLVLGVMIVLFLVGEQLPMRVVPPAVAIVGASLALLAVYSAKVEPVEHVFKDIDWKTLLFLICMFTMVQAFTKTGILRALSQHLYQVVRGESAGRWTRDAGGNRDCLKSARQHPGGRRVDPHGQRVLRDGRAGARRGAGHALHGLAGLHLARLRGHDVRGDFGRQRDPHWRGSQCGECRHLCRAWEAAELRDVPALWRAVDPLPVGGIGPLCAGTVLRHWSLAAA